MTRILSKDTPAHTGQTITVSGWVNSRRDHGGLIFIDVRDHTGVVQVVIHPEASEAFATAETVRDEYVLTVVGQVTDRDENLKNPNIASGTIEIVAETITILNKSEPLPVAVSDDGQQSNEELRLKYRYLDLRRPKMQQTLKRRSEYYKFIRSYMDEQTFTEVTTPILANSSPEGARDFLVPSRVHPGRFYALPQAPQQFKQLLMVGGLDRYYQIATCFRDEDPRADRLYGDFYQLDLEMSFVDNGETIRSTMEPLIKRLVTEFGSKELLSDEIPRIAHQDAMDRFGSDKPDLRFGMELTDLSEELATTEFGVFKNTLASGGVVKAIRVEGGASLSRKQMDEFTQSAVSEGAGGLPYIKLNENGSYTTGVMISFNSSESIKSDFLEALSSPIVKFLTPDERIATVAKLGAKPGDLIVFGSDKRDTVNKVLGKLRSEFADHFELKDPNKVALSWIVDFPFYEWDDGAKKVDFGHNPFSMPRGGAAVLTEADTDEKKLAIVADQYDMVMNGYEIASGAVRNHNPEVMYEAFGVLGYSREYVEEKFGAMLSAFKFGAPPHAGAAFGIDRIFMVLSNETNIREVVAFPKNGSGVDAMMRSPSVVDDAQLKELQLKIIE